MVFQNYIFEGAFLFERALGYETMRIPAAGLVLLTNYECDGGDLS